MSWQAQEASPQQVLAEEQPDKVLVELTDGSKLVLDEPAMSGDTLVGLEQGEQRSIPLSDVSVLEVRKTDNVLTFVAIFGGLVVTAAAVVAIWLATCEDCLGT
jgi:hypothetical protein